MGGTVDGLSHSTQMDTAMMREQPLGHQAEVEV